MKNYLVTLICIVFMILSVSGDTCLPASQIQFTSQNSRIEINGGIPISIRGTNWFGMESCNFVPEGLGQNSLDNIMSFLQSTGVNAIRIPFSLDIALNPTQRYAQGINGQYNPSLVGLTSIEVLDQIFLSAQQHGILILLDEHRFTCSSPYPPLWYSTSCINNPGGQCVTYTIQSQYTGWTYLVNRYKSYWNFWGIDLLNEPHASARWGYGGTGSDWARAALSIGNYVITNVPDWKGLILIEGVQYNPACEITGYPGCESCSNDGHWWGGNMEGIRCYEIPLSDPNRLVYSPHVYGSSVYQQPYFTAPSFPNNLEYIYDAQFGFILNTTNTGVVIGEWGGYPGTDEDGIILSYQASYFQRKGISCSFLWCINPDSSDTDGLLEGDWSTPNSAYVSFIKSAVPNPTVFTQSGSNVCFSGSYTAPGPTVNPTTIPFLNENPTTAAPTTKAPTTAAPTTKAPTTAAPTTAAPTTQPPTTTPTNGGQCPSGWSYVGCWTDSSSSRTLYSQAHINTTGMTNEGCAQYCQYYKYFGTEIGRECYCGNVLKSTGYQVADSQCNVRCAGDGSEICGAGNRLSVCQKSSTVSAPTTAAPTAPSTTTPTPTTAAPTPAPTTTAPTPAPTTTAPTPAPTTAAPTTSGGIVLSTQSGSSDWWLAVAVSNDPYNGPITKVEFSGSGSGAWYSTVQQSYNPYPWTVTFPSAQSLPISVRLTSSSGKVITANNIITSFNQASYNTGQNF